MNESAQLVVENIGKRFARTQRSQRRQAYRNLGAALIGRPVQPPTDDEFWAVRNVSFSLGDQESLGVLGLNGSGKSTLLAMIAGQLKPDEGAIRSSVGIGSLIGLQTGFDPQLSGRENIETKSQLMGWSELERRDRFESIVAFSELENFIDAPMRTYSNGMKMRLGFSIATFDESRLLILDEILAVGDYIFRQKCLAKLNEMKKTKSFILVSHNPIDISRFCDKAIVLDKGALAFEGSAGDALEYYHGLNRQVVAENTVTDVAFLGEMFCGDGAVADVRHGWAEEIDVEPTGAPVYESAFLLIRPTKTLLLSVAIWTMDGQLVTGMSSEASVYLNDLPGSLEVSMRMTIRHLNLNPGRYVSIFFVHDGMETLYKQHDEPFEIPSDGLVRWGVITPQTEWSVETHNVRDSVSARCR